MHAKQTYQNWFKNLRSGDFSLKDDQRYSHRPTEVDDDQINAIIEERHHIIVRETTERLNVSDTIKFFGLGNVPCGLCSA